MDRTCFETLVFTVFHIGRSDEGQRHRRKATTWSSWILVYPMRMLGIIHYWGNWQ